MDLLSAVLREVQFSSAAYRWLDLRAPFRTEFDQPQLRGVHIIARGSCELVFPDGTVQPLHEGDLVILPRGDHHALRSRDDATDTLVVCGAFLVGQPDHPVLRGLPRTVYVPSGDGAWVAPLVAALSAEAFDGGPGSDLVMARLSDAMLIRALRHHSVTTGHPGWLAGLRDPYIAPALAAVHADLARPWTLSGLAAEAGLSRAAFAARFSERVGEPAMRYVLALRMQRAKSLLRDRRATVAAVAGQVGYQSEVGFAASFKREVGVSPGSYHRSPEPGNPLFRL